MGMKKTDMIRCVYIFLAFFYPFSWPFVVFIVISIYNLYLVFWTEAWMGLDSSGWLDRIYIYIYCTYGNPRVPSFLGLISPIFLELKSA